MKNFKKLMALVIAAAMVIGSLNAFAATGENGLTTDANISITGLENGDIVNLFKVLEWEDGTGWVLTDDFEGLDAEGVNALIANTPNTQLSAADLAAIATAAQGHTPINAVSGTSEAAPISGTTFTYDAGTQTTAGMYIALVKAAKAGTVYNPIIVSADFSATNSTNTIPASSVINGTSVAKRKDITLEKTEPLITEDDGDVYEYTIETTIPVYSDAFTGTFFTLSDKLSEYVDILHGETYKEVAYNITVTDADTDETIDVTSYLTVDADDHGFTITFPHEYVDALTAAKNIKVVYSGKLNVPKSQLTNVKEEKNDVTVKFPNNPNDLTGKKVTALKDGTREYTFTLDGKLFGNSSWDTAELVKVGLDQNNSPIEALINVSNGSEHAALANAVFGLFPSTTAADAYINAGKDGSEILAIEDDAAQKEAAQQAGFYTNSVFNGVIVTDVHGLMEINGLDAGTYVLRELDAPSGYIKDGDNHTVTITANINGDEPGETGEAITEYYTVDNEGNVTWSPTPSEGSTEYTYYVPVLTSYTVTVGTNETSYEMTLSGPNVSSVTPAESSTDIANTKGVELPSTGGMGTTLFYAIGAILVLGAGILLVSKRRMAAN